MMELIDATAGFRNKPELEGPVQRAVTLTRLGEGNLRLHGKADGTFDPDVVWEHLDREAERFEGQDVRFMIFDEPHLAFYKADTPDKASDIVENGNSLKALFDHKAGRPHRLSWYQSGGIKDLWRPVARFHFPFSQEREEAYQEWIHSNLALIYTFDYRGVIQGKSALFDVDALYPSMYLHYAGWFDDDEREETWINANMSMIMQISRITGKKVYPYVWGQFHDSYRVIPEARFRRRLEQMASFGIDGFAHWDWGGRTQDWARPARDRRIIEEVISSQPQSQ